MGLLLVRADGWEGQARCWEQVRRRTFDGLVASSPGARLSRRQCHYMPGCHMSQPPASEQNVTARVSSAAQGTA